MSHENAVGLTVVCDPFGRGRARHEVLVETGEDPRVRVWDPIGRIFTVCHRLSIPVERRIIARATGGES